MVRRTRITTDTITDHRLQRRRRRAAWQAEQRHAEGRVLRLAVVRPIARTALAPGTVVWEHIPYEETDGYKLRPVVVGSLSGRDVTVYPGTTSDKRHLYRRGYRELSDLESAGLRRATGIELAAVTIDVAAIVSVAGSLSWDDHLMVLGSGPAYEDLPHYAPVATSCRIYAWAWVDRPRWRGDASQSFCDLPRLSRRKLLGGE